MTKTKKKGHKSRVGADKMQLLRRIGLLRKEQEEKETSWEWELTEEWSYGWEDYSNEKHKD